MFLPYDIQTSILYSEPTCNIKDRKEEAYLNGIYTL